MTRRRSLSVLALLAAFALPAGCTSDPAGGSARGPRTIEVPRDAATISAAVDQARPGDLVLVSPGVYRETVQIDTPRIVLRGTDRNKVIVDGAGTRPNGIVVTAPEVALENVTVRDHLLNGVLVTGMSDDSGAGVGAGYEPLDPEKFPPLQGFAVRYVTSYNNGLYGIYAFDAAHGVLEHNYTSGSADSGIYVGQCKPCNILVRDNVSERNAVGYENTNASGPLWVLRNRFSHNRVGLTVGSDYLEAFVPQQGATVAGNLVTGNAEPRSPAQADGGFGIGVGIAGGHDNVVLRNRIDGNPYAGLILASSEDIGPVGNRVEGNVIAGNGAAVAYTAGRRAPGERNCLRGNDIRGATWPAGLARSWACGGSGPAGPAGPGVVGVPLPRQVPPGGVAFQDVPAPPPQPQMPGGADAPVDAARGLPGPVSVAGVGVPPLTLYRERSGFGR